MEVSFTTTNDAERRPATISTSRRPAREPPADRLAARWRSVFATVGPCGARAARPRHGSTVASRRDPHTLHRGCSVLTSHFASWPRVMRTRVRLLTSAMPSTFRPGPSAPGRARRLARTSAAARDRATAASGALALKNDGGPARCATTGVGERRLLGSGAPMRLTTPSAPRGTQPSVTPSTGSPSATCCQSGFQTVAAALGVARRRGGGRAARSCDARRRRSEAPPQGVGQSIFLGQAAPRRGAERRLAARAAMA